MAENHFKVTIYINCDVDDIIKAKQKDAASRYLDVTLVDDSGSAYDLTDTVVRFNALKRDGTYIFNNAVITDAENGEFQVELTDQTLALEGTVFADITIFSDDGAEILTTRTFCIAVQQTVRNDQAIESSNEYGAVTTLFQDVWDMRQIIISIDDKIGSMTDEIPLGGQQAGETIFGALNKFWNYLITQSTAGIVEVVNFIKTTIGIANPTTAGTDTVMNYLKKIDDRVVLGAVKSIQRGVVRLNAASGSATVSAVDMSKANLHFLGFTIAESGGISILNPVPYMYLSNSTTIFVNTGGAGNYNAVISWELVEYY